MLTRCPHCQTVFRASQEQLAAHHGQARCGACHHPFNAHAHLVKEDEDIFLFAWQEDEPQSVPPPATPDAPCFEMPSPETSRAFSAASPSDESPPPEEEEPITVMPPLDPIDELLSFQLEENSSSEFHKAPAEKAQTAEEIHQHGLETGMVAARHRNELPDFSSWSAPPLDGDPPAYTLWPFILAAVFFAFLLFAQVILHFRSEISHNSPPFANLLKTMGVDVPFAREPEYLSIEGSELQTLEGPDRLRLFATLRNKAQYSLAWPHLEISLTDTYNTVLVRKVFSPDEYLTRAQASGVFAPGNALIQLDLGARAIAPSGYNLYLFYP
ncbi:MAG: zinc-ribbon domain-containing protein [Betaproteobacteria bacterium]|nr:zinc-ribbon domain-containing protein [Betaproteobacteria bacterium]